MTRRDWLVLTLGAWFVLVCARTGSVAAETNYSNRFTRRSATDNARSVEEDKMTVEMPPKRPKLLAEKPSLSKKLGSHPSAFGRRVNRTARWERSGDILSGFRNMYQFDVLHDTNDSVHPFKAWFFGWAVEDSNPGYSGSDAIFFARSRKLDSDWEVYSGDDEWEKKEKPNRWAPVVTARDLYFDAWHNGDPSVVKVKGLYFMAYSSTGHNKDGEPYGHPEDSDGSFLCVMGAVSDGGIHWRRSQHPILSHSEDFGAPTDPRGDSHLYGSYHRPSLLHEDGKFRLWFDYWAPTGVTMGYAENDGDFLNPKDWRVVRAGELPCLKEFPNPDVVRVNDLYFAYGDPCGYGSHPWTSRKIAEAVSLDGLDWVVLGYVEPDSDAPAIHVPQAFVWREGAKTWIYVFYACQIGGDPYDYRYNRIRYMRRVISDEELELCRTICRDAVPGAKR